MNIDLSVAAPADEKADLLAIGCAEDTLEDNALLDAFDTTLAGFLRAAIRTSASRARPARASAFATHGRLAAARLALSASASAPSITLPALRTFAGRAARLAQSVGARRLALLAPLGFLGPQPELSALAERLVEGVLLGSYRFDKYLSEDKRTPPSLTDVIAAARLAPTTPASGGPAPAAEAWPRAVARARDLINEPAGYMTPTRLAEVAQAVASRARRSAAPCSAPRSAASWAWACSSRSPRAASRSRASSTWPGSPPTPASASCWSARASPSTRAASRSSPTIGMLDMKTDMSGAAAVHRRRWRRSPPRQLPVEVHALAACTENMPSGSAYKLGDVLRSKAGKTVEINNTDAEGRLTLADAITYGLELKPDALLDFATLTGACIVALGPHTAGVMSNNDALATAWLDAAKAAGEEMWRLPLPDRLREQLKSDVADMKNTGRALGRRAHRRAVPARVRRRDPLGSRRSGRPVHRRQGRRAKSPRVAPAFAVATIVEYLRRLARRDVRELTERKSRLEYRRFLSLSA